jgi:ureidoglycolate amidohydrolase
MNVRVNTGRLMAELDQLASLTDCQAIPDPRLPMPQRAVTRIVFTPRDLEARTWFKTLAQTAGFGVREDAVGNTFVRWRGTEPHLKPVGTGSHIDAIPFAGMYDGTVGVLGGLEAMRALKESGFQPRRSLELVMFTSEEPTRFGIGCLGSRIMGGVLDPVAADALPDRLCETDPTAAAGGTLRTMREAAGFRGALDQVRLRPGHYAGWVELHIEQGPLLERDGQAIGVVTHIAGPSSYRFTVEGLGGHAGALLMPDRRDALCAAAELILAIERAALAANKRSGTVDTVATVGKLDVYPGAVNAVPSRVTLMLDVRDTDAARRTAVMDEVRVEANALAERRGVRITEELINADAPAVCDQGIVQRLDEICTSQGIASRHMVSRAYHDTSFMAQIAPVAMLFVPCKGGVSHRPDEYASPQGITLGVQVLAAALARLSLQT